MESVICALAVLAAFVVFLYSDNVRVFAKKRVAWGQIPESDVKVEPMLFPPYLPGIAPMIGPDKAIWAKYPTHGAVALPITMSKTQPKSYGFGPQSTPRSYSSPSEWYPVPVSELFKE